MGSESTLEWAILAWSTQVQHDYSLQERASQGVVGRETHMESIQCLEDMPKAKITKELCLPPTDYMARQLIALSRELRIYVFVASDVEGEKHSLQQLLERKVGVAE